MNTLCIHDLAIEDIQEKWPTPINTWKMIGKTSLFKTCIGCFGCWIKTPGQCVILDGYEGIGALYAASDTIVIISRCLYGGQSPFVKSVLDRGISFVLPLFKTRAGRMCHQRRYRTRPNLKMMFYGADISEEEKATARKLLESQARNLFARNCEVQFFDSLESLKEGIV